MENPKYLPRIIDSAVEAHLEAFGAVEIAGSMWSGKTWTADHHGTSKVRLTNAQTRALASIDPQAILQGDKPHVIDEWQEVPQIWDVVRTSIDEAGGERDMYILTGSSTPAKDKVRHTGSGRISRLNMWPMSLYESGLSTGKVSLRDLFEGRFQGYPCETDLNVLATRICRGGWPGALGLSDRAATLVPGQYVSAILEKDEAEMPGDRQEAQRFLRSLARNTGSAVTLETLAKDMGLSVEGSSKDASTRIVRAFLGYFLNRYVICALTGWDAPIKSPRRLRTKPKYGFADPSLTAAMIGADAACESLLRLKRKVAANPAARNPEPSFLMVLVGKSDFVYRTPEGVVVVPVTELGV